MNFLLFLQRCVQNFKLYVSLGSLENKYFKQEKYPLLTKRQTEILAFLAKGLSNKEIAAELKISVKTVETHLSRIYRILNTDGRIGAVVKFATDRNFKIT